MNKYFRLYANCIPIKGADDSLVVDFQRKKVYRVENNTLEALEIIYQIDIKEIYDVNKKIYQNICDLENNELGFFTNNPDSFPEISEHWDVPNVITNADVLVGENSKHDFNYLFTQFDNLQCKNVSLKFEYIPIRKDLDEWLNIALEKNINHLELWFINKISRKYIKTIVKKHPHIKKMKIFNSKKKDIFYEQSQIYYSDNRTFENYCKNEPCPIVIDFAFYFESKQFNNCLNKKVAIDKNHNIKNCLYLNKSYGKYEDVNIQNIVCSSEFQKQWHIKKDVIETCKDCEYRYICMDCRAFVENPDNPYSKPFSCIKK